MGLLEELESYRQPNGLYSNVQNPPNDSSGNCIAISSLGMWLAFRIGEMRGPGGINSLKSFQSSINACLVPGYSGLLNRSPTKTDQEGWDDYVTLVAATATNCLNLPICARILDQCDKTMGFFNNVNPGKPTVQSFLARYPQFVAHLCMANGIDPSFVLKAAWSAGVMAASFSSDTSTLVLNYLMADTAKRMGLCESAISVFLNRNGQAKMKTTVAQWLGNANHPIVLYWDKLGG